MKIFLQLSLVLISQAMFGSDQILNPGKYEIANCFGFNTKMEIEILEENKIHVTRTMFGCMVQSDGSVPTWVHEFHGYIRRNEQKKVIFEFIGEDAPSPFDRAFRRVSKNKITSKLEWRETIRRIEKE